MAVARLLLMVKSYTYKTEDDANDALYGVASLPGYVFGYVGSDRTKYRTYTFHERSAESIGNAVDTSKLPTGICVVTTISKDI